MPIPLIVTFWISREKRTLIIAGALVACTVGALVGFDQITRMQNERIEKQLRDPANPQAKHVRDSKEAMASLLLDLEHKSFRDKVNDAYDGAIKTHEIGFPVTAGTQGAAGAAGKEKKAGAGE
ncbi:hypothetical protein B484DRAFT_414382 [Ochromonadaceae sp. CCMP2298]|nr:hypothetical protein B484DRAFT_414382 [Ochromonadaceae sp. CCMP2298]